MGYQVPRSLVEAFYEVYATRDADRIATTASAGPSAGHAVEQVIGRPLAVHEDELYNDVIEL